MKKLTKAIQQIILIVTILCIVNLCAPLPVIVDPAFAGKKVYIKDALTGGTSTSLDGIGVSSLNDGDVCFIYDTNDRSYIFEFQASATDSENTSTHPYYVRPDDYASAGVWYEQADGYVDRPSINLITNSSLSVWSNSVDLYNVGSAINITGVTNGVCYTADYEDVQVGDLVEISGTTVFEVTAVSAGVSFTVNDTEYCDSAVSGYEVMPGCVAVDNLGSDGWYKYSTGLDIYRVQEDSTHCKGFYGMKIVKSGDGNERIRIQTTGIQAKQGYYNQFIGRPITLGIWVYSVSAADNVKIYLYDGIDVSQSSFAPTDTLTWLEISRTMSNSTDQFIPYISLEGDTGDVAYISQPQLSFGHYIGEGNYIQPPGEVIWLESGVTMTDYNGATVSGSTEINLEVQTQGKIPKGVKAVYAQITAQCANTDKYIALLSKSGGISGPRIEDILVANKYHTAVGWCPCDADGDIYIERDGTFTNVTIKILGVEIR